jgi:putative membrane protein
MNIRRIIGLLLTLFALNTLFAVGFVLLGHRPPLASMLLVTFLPFAVALLHAWERLGWRKMLLMLATTTIVSLLFESIGVATGRVYGPYHYADFLRPQFLGLVPIFVPLGWFLMSYPAFILADWITPAQWPAFRRLLAVAALGALAMTAWDVVMDPARTFVGQWVWEKPGPYFGIPLQNYLGWWITVFVALAAFMALARYTPARRHRNFDRLAIISYGLIALAEIISAVALGLNGPALAGLFATLPWFLWGWIATDSKN